MKNRFAVIMGLLLCSVPIAFSQPLGDFTDQAIIGDNWSLPDDNSYVDGVYEILASGTDIWDTADNFTFVYKEVTGNFMATCDANWGPQEIPGDDPTNIHAGNEWKKMGIMARDSIADPYEPGARHAMCILRNDDAADVQARPTQGGSSVNIGITSKTAADTNVIRLVRIGDTFTMYRGTVNGGFNVVGSQVVDDMPETLNVGLCVTAHDVNALERAFFSDVVIEAIEIGALLNRTAPSTTVIPGELLAGVQLEMTVDEGFTADAVVTEAVPEGWTIANVNADAGTTNIVNGAIVWDLPGASGTATLTYDLTVAANAGKGDVSINGAVTIGGKEFLADGDIDLFVMVDEPIGIFQDHLDIGSPGAEGSATYDADTGTYTIEGSGHDIWDAADDFHFVYSEVSGDVNLIATVDLQVGGGEPDWAKAGPMVRNNLTPGSAHGFAMIRNGGQDYGPQWRETQGAGGAWDGDASLVGGKTNNSMQEGKIEIERIGTEINFYYYDPVTDEQIWWYYHDVPDMEDPVYVGLAVTSHTTGAISTGIFTDVVLMVDGEIYEPVAVGEWALY